MHLNILWENLWGPQTKGKIFRAAKVGWRGGGRWEIYLLKKQGRVENYLKEWGGIIANIEFYYIQQQYKIYFKN